MKKVKRDRRRQRRLLGSLPDAVFDAVFMGGRTPPDPAIVADLSEVDRARTESELRRLADEEKLDGLDDMVKVTRQSQAASLALKALKSMQPPGPRAPDDPFAEVIASLIEREQVRPRIDPEQQPALTRLVTLLVLADCAANDDYEDERITKRRPAPDDAPTRKPVAHRRSRDPVATIEYRCPTHGKVEPEDDSAAVPVCPMSLRRVIAGETVVEPCGQPLTAH